MSALLQFALVALGHDAIDGLDEIAEGASGDHDAVAAAAGVLGDTDELAAVILVEIEEELLALDGEGFAGETLGGVCAWAGCDHVVFFLFGRRIDASV